MENSRVNRDRYETDTRVSKKISFSPSLFQKNFIKKKKNEKENDLKIRFDLKNIKQHLNIN